MTTRTDVLDELEWRGLIADSTDREALRQEMAAGPVTFYVGIDPTAPSLHMGHLVQLLTARRLQEAGHLPLVLIGGATGLIGDPKESTERVLNPKETVAEWTEKLRGQTGRFLDIDGEHGGQIVNNYDWTEGLSAIDFLRDIGKHFPVNRMLDREAVRARLESGISYTEFSYVLLQAMDYLELFRRHDCRLQTGGSDQWGNITAGVELIRRTDGARVHALATPLVTKTDGTKFGKTESGTVWIDAEMTSPYAYYQFWFNTDDRDVITLLKYYSFRSREEILDLEAQLADRPQDRAAQRALARELTTLTHGAEETTKVEAAAGALFGSSALDELDDRTLAAALRETNLVTIHGSDTLPSVVDLYVRTGLATSKSAARRMVHEGGAYLNNERVNDPEAAPGKEDLLHGRWLVLRKGKRTMAGVEVAP